MSITRDQMSLQIDRLIDVFGEKAFSDQREHMIWEVIEGLEYRQVIGIVDTFIRSNKYAPLPVDFSTASEGLGRKSHGALGEISENPNCSDCADSGFLRVVRLETFEPWAKAIGGSSACHCSRGHDVLSKLKNAPRCPVDLKCQWGPSWESSYRKLPASAPQWDGPFKLAGDFEPEEGA